MSRGRNALILARNLRIELSQLLVHLHPTLPPLDDVLVLPRVLMDELALLEVGVERVAGFELGKTLADGVDGRLPVERKRVAVAPTAPYEKGGSVG
jgi:hypothetical protein